MCQFCNILGQSYVMYTPLQLVCLVHEYQNKVFFRKYVLFSLPCLVPMIEIWLLKNMMQFLFLSLLC